MVKTFVGPAYESGGTIIYVRDGAIVTQPFDERKLVVLGEPVAMPDHVAVSTTNNTALFSVSPAGNLVYYPAPSGPFALSWYDRDGRRGDTLDTGPIREIALSPDGTRVAESIYNPNGLNPDLWSYDMSRHTKTRLTSSLEDEGRPVWQPDGQFVLFASGFGGSPDHIYRTRSDGSGGIETVLRSEGVNEVPGSICRDGRYLAYTRSSKDSPPAVWILPLTGDRKPFALIQTRVNSPVFSPDCKWIAYVSGQNRGVPDVYLAKFPDATHQHQVSTQSGNLLRWRGDSKELFYFSPPQNSIIAVNVEEEGGEISLGAPQTLFPLSSPYASFLGFDVTPDGKRFLISTVNFPTASIPLTLVTNWEAELKKK
ncbi:TolB family protein [Edaphobacter aggregans]|uniref:TolB family protein n=1 Tax=Edaphobacter aggregans TaxID=570835 RepID=UPI000554CCDC|nr:PD40 domain-containing protein [Edaphobacter aggregans]